MTDQEQAAYIATVQTMTGAEIIFELENQWMDLWSGVNSGVCVDKIRLIRRVLVARIR